MLTGKLAKSMAIVEPPLAAQFAVALMSLGDGVGQPDMRAMVNEVGERDGDAVGPVGDVDGFDVGKSVGVVGALEQLSVRPLLQLSSYAEPGVCKCRRSPAAAVSFRANNGDNEGRRVKTKDELGRHGTTLGGQG